MHITEFSGIYLVILWDKINSFCRPFRAHAQKNLWWLAWEPHCRADESKHSEGRYQDSALRGQNLGEVASDLRSFGVIEVLLLAAIDKCKQKFVALLCVNYVICIFMRTSTNLMYGEVICRVTDCIGVVFLRNDSLWHMPHGIDLPATSMSNYSCHLLYGQPFLSRIHSFTHIPFCIVANDFQAGISQQQLAHLTKGASTSSRVLYYSLTMQQTHASSCASSDLHPSCTLHDSRLVTGSSF